MTSGEGVDDDYRIGYLAGLSLGDGTFRYQPIAATESGLRTAAGIMVGPDGGTLVFSTYFGGPLEEDAKDVAIDREGNAYVVGYAKSARCAPDLALLGGVQPSPAGSPGRHDGFVIKYDPKGRLVAGTWIGGEEEDFLSGVAVGPVPGSEDEDRVLVLGTTRSEELLRKLLPGEAAAAWPAIRLRNQGLPGNLRIAASRLRGHAGHGWSAAILCKRPLFRALLARRRQVPSPICGVCSTLDAPH